MDNERMNMFIICGRFTVNDIFQEFLNFHGIILYSTPYNVWGLSIYFSSILKSRSNPFLEPTSTKQ